MISWLLSLSYQSYALLSLLAYYIFFKSDPARLAGVYSQPGKWFWLKYKLIKFGIERRRAQSAAGEKKTSDSAAGYGAKSRNNAAEMEKVQILDGPTAVDAVYFNASNTAGNYIVAATARRSQGKIQTVFILRLIIDGEACILMLPNMPDTMLTETEPNAYAAGGLTISPRQPMKTWTIKYHGKLVDQKSGREFDSHVDLNWEAYGDYFDFDTDMTSSATARAIACEPWSREYFQRLQSAHQTHYEQFGDISGQVELLGADEIVAKEIGVQGLKGVRDHSYGRHRDWKDIHRYALHYICLDNGTRLAASVVSMPGTLSRIEIGFVIDKSGGKPKALEWMDIPFHLLGENGKPPKEFSFNCQIDDDDDACDRKFHIVAKVIDRPIFFMGEEWDGKVWEQMATFTVNGISGSGFAEWAYRNLNDKGVLN